MKRGFRTMIRALRRACAYPHPAGRIACIETHLSVVCLAGRYAYKLKKPVDFGFVDYASAAARLRACRDEARLNRPLAKPLYLGVVPVVRRARSYAIAACGEAVGHAVRMRSFSEDDVYASLAARHALARGDVDRLAQRLADFHRHAPRDPPMRRFGTARCVRAQIEAVLASLEREAPGCVPAALREGCAAELARLAGHLDARRAAGFVRGCHGDLHLANIVRHGRDVLMFDCIEFSDALRWIDIVSDLAFPVMDLLAYGRPDLASRLVNQWVCATGDFAGLAALRLFVVYRALVRALVAQLKARESGARSHAPDAARYLRVATHVIAPQTASLLLCHGFPGSGKSAASAALAPMTGALRVSSDVERKRRAPLAAAARAPLPATAYVRAALDAQYERLLSIADALLRSGYPVIVDAGFLRQAHRARFIEAARRCGAPVFIVDFHAPRERLEQRVIHRSMVGRDPSDADVAVLHQQLADAQPLTAEESALTVALDTDVALAAFDTPGYWRALLERLPAPGWLADRTTQTAPREPA